MQRNTGPASGCSGVLGLQHNFQSSGNYDTVSATHKMRKRWKKNAFNINKSSP